MQNHMILVGAYWAERSESKEQAAERIVRFLRLLNSRGSQFQQWFSKGGSKASARAALSPDVVAVTSVMEANRRDTDGGEIAELGFNLAIWNGASVSFEATIGSFSPHVSNSALLTVANGAPSLGSLEWKSIIEAAIQAFDPQHAVVTSHEHLSNPSVVHPWEIGWFTYERGGELRQHSLSEIAD